MHSFYKTFCQKMKKYYKIKHLILRYLHIYRNRKPSRDTQNYFPISYHFQSIKEVLYKCTSDYAWNGLHLNDSFFIRLDVFVNWNQWDKFLLWGKKFLHCITNPSGLLYYSEWLEYTEISCTGGRFVEVSWTMYVCLPVLINIYKKKTSKIWRENFYDDHVNNLKIIRKKKNTYM